jgi:1,4-alpha-glucan branching enzyme
MEGFSILRVSAIALSFLILCQCAPAVWQTEESDGKVSVLFTYIATDARRVCISGNFNHWSKTSHCLTKNGETWFVEIRLSPGKYSYLFVIDDNRWQVDPEAPLREENGFGTENSVLIVQ